MCLTISVTFPPLKINMPIVLQSFINDICIWKVLICIVFGMIEGLTHVNLYLWRNFTATGWLDFIIEFVIKSLIVTDIVIQEKKYMKYVWIAESFFL